MAIERRHYRGGKGLNTAWQKPPQSDIEALRMGGIALKNGLILVTERHWAAAIRESDGTINTASGDKVRLPGSGEKGDAATGAAPGGTGRAHARTPGVPILRGLERFAETLVVLGLVKKRMPNASLPLQGGRVALALAASLVATEAVRAVGPKSALGQEVGTAIAGFLPAVLALKGSAISGYHGAEHKVIGGREIALRAATDEGATLAEAERSVVAGDSAAAAKEHDRCGSNLVGPYLLATIATNLLARGRSGKKSPVASAAAGAASLGLALEALRWSSRHGDHVLSRLMLAPGRAVQKVLTTSEPTPGQLEVGERALEELLRVEGAS
jgi:hypothetical protein